MIFPRINLPNFVQNIKANWDHAYFCLKQDFPLITTVNINSLNTDSWRGLAGAYSGFQLRGRGKSGRRPRASRLEGPRVGWGSCLLVCRFELSRHVEIARTCSKLVADRFEVKFRYTIWSQTGSKLVADLSQTC